MEIRFVKPEDCRQILDIYGQYINTSITFEYELPSEEDFAKRIEEISEIYPYLVLEENDKIFGYAYAHRLRERAAYQGLRSFRFTLTKILPQKVTVGFCMKNYWKSLNCKGLKQFTAA